jgi:L-lactate dehydrogenase
MKRRVGIIGLGRVGASVAISTLISGVADELLLNDMRTEVAEAEAMDMAHGESFYPAATVIAASIEDMFESDAIVVSAGRAGRPDESRLDLLRDNANVVGAIGHKLKGYRGTIVVISNPVDILTLVMTRAADLPPARVIGTGTMLDTARLRQAIGHELRLDPHSVDAQVVGEHGDSEVALWSGALAGGVPVRAWPGWNPAREPKIAEEVRTAATEIIKRKGATNHAIGLVTAHLLRCILRGEDRVVTVTRVQEGAIGLRDIAISLPTVVGAEGGRQIVEPTMNDEERERLHRSVEVLRKAANKVI